MNQRFEHSSTVEDPQIEQPKVALDLGDTALMSELPVGTAITRTPADVAAEQNAELGDLRSLPPQVDPFEKFMSRR